MNLVASKRKCSFDGVENHYHTHRGCQVGGWPTLSRLIVFGLIRCVGAPSFAAPSARRFCASLDQDAKGGWITLRSSPALSLPASNGETCSMPKALVT